MTSKEVVSLALSDFRTVDMTTIQENDPTFAEASVDGNYVRFYNEQDKYLYDVKINETGHVEDYLITPSFRFVVRKEVNKIG